MAVSRRKQQYDVFIGHNKINQTNNYAYLGVSVNEDNLQLTEINGKIAKYNKNVSMLYPLLKDRHVPRKI